MKKFVLFGVFYLLLFSAFAKKDSQAWKAEKTLENQYSIFKDNSSRWDGYIMTKEPQINELHKSMMDTINGLEKKIANANTEIATSKRKIKDLSKQLLDTQTNLDTSLTKENELVSLGISFNKNSFPTVMYCIILLTIGVAVFAFLLFFRSNAITKETEKLHQDISDELQSQKISSLERETKLRRELQTERNKNYSV